MTKFETIGVEHQHSSNNIAEAIKFFKHSCNCCCSKGMHLDCEKCSIAYVHNLVVASFNDMRKQENTNDTKGK